MASRYPNFAERHTHDALFSPDEVVASLSTRDDLQVPDAVVLTYQRSLVDELESRGVEATEGYPGPWRSLWFVESGARSVAVAGRFGIGAPVAAMVMEELIALGVREFVSIGNAGCPQPHCALASAVVCTGAIRDEVSHHYAATEKFAWPSPALTERLTDALTQRGAPIESGLAWTIDAPYRETTTELLSYQAEGVLCVEMEAAALFAVADYRGVDVTAAFVVSDHLLAEERWTHAFGTDVQRVGASQLLDAALRAVRADGLPR